MKSRSIAGVAAAAAAAAAADAAAAALELVVLALDDCGTTGVDAANGVESGAWEDALACNEPIGAEGAGGSSEAADALAGNVDAPGTTEVESPGAGDAIGADIDGIGWA
jgi:hypothetical protein